MTKTQYQPPPKWLAELPVWLRWRPETASDGRVLKVPYYSTGSRRSGELDRPEDRAQLVTRDKLNTPGDFRAGFALGPVNTDLYINGIDLDDCIGDDGVIPKTHPFFPFLEESRARGAMIDLTPSGRGYHVVWLDRRPIRNIAQYTVEGAGGIEQYGGGRFFTYGTLLVPGDGRANGDMHIAMTTLPPKPERTKKDAATPAKASEGGRNVHLYARRVELQRQGLRDDALADALMYINETQCEPPLSETEVKAVARRGGSRADISTTPQQVFQSFGDVPELQSPYVSLLTSQQVMNSTDKVEWLVKGLVEQRALGMVWGPPAAFKSFVVLDWALSIATGTRWFGHDVTQRPVYYVAGEGRRGITKRIKAWFAEQGREPDLTGFYLSKGAVNARDDNFAKAMIEMSEETGAPGLIVIDTLNRNFGGGDENSAQDVGKLLDVCDRQLGQQLGATVILVHHSTKDSGNYRGSSALHGGMDFEYEVAREHMNAVLISRKVKDGPEPPTITIQFTEHNAFTQVAHHAPDNADSSIFE
jgi:hypothetical protein